MNPYCGAGGGLSFLAPSSGVLLIPLCLLTIIAGTVLAHADDASGQCTKDTPGYDPGTGECALRIEDDGANMSNPTLLSNEMQNQAPPENNTLPEVTPDKPASASELNNQQEPINPGIGLTSENQPPNSQSNNSTDNRIFDETTGKFESPLLNPGTSDSEPLRSNPAEMTGTDAVFNETTGRWETQPPPSGCRMLLDNCGPSVSAPAYPTPELPKNPLTSPPQPPGTVLQYDEARGAQNYQYMYPAQSTFNSGVTASGPGLQGQSVSPQGQQETPTLNVLQRFFNWFGSLFR
jgi:hypothetical protein